ncbi:MAG: sigma-70 family RNA polymerase sigma factor [Ruminococcus sp.]|jgi:RNA polymerase sigma-70 factor (ECF subfamily)|nr:sigma-70 family RNA polymerase sigma factor [Ruminococcus sp.]
MYASLKREEEETLTLRAVYEQNAGLLYNFAFRILHSKEAAEDAVETLFLRLLSERDSLFAFDEPQRTARLVVSVKNIAFDILRKNKHNAFSLDDEYLKKLPSGDLPIDFVAERQNTYALMKKAVSELPESYRTVFEMKYVLGMSYAEIGERLHISRGKINGILRRSRARIKKSMEEGEV